MATTNNNELLRTMNQLGEKVLAELITEIQRQKMVASSTLLNSLSYRVVEVIKYIEYRLEVRGVDYALNSFDGRPVGRKQPPLSKIKAWCAFKGIPKEAAFPIARNIARFGLPPRNVLRNVLKSSLITEFQNKINEAYQAQLISEINNIINEK